MKQKSTSNMKLIATAALMLNFGVAGIHAETVSVDLSVSGTAANSTVQTTPGTPASEYNLAGGGILDPFTFRVVSTSAANPASSNTCSGPNKLFFPIVAGAGVLRSSDGSLLTVNLTAGSDCIDLVAGQALCTRIFQIAGGTGRFKNASGSVTLTMTVVPVLGDNTNNPVFFAVTGEVKGTASKVSLWP